MKALFSPIDTSLTFNQANLVLNQIKPKCVYVHENYLKRNLSASGPSANEISITYAGECIGYRRNSIFNLPMKCERRKIKIDSVLADNVNLKRYENGSSIGSVVGEMSIVSNKLLVNDLEPSTETPQTSVTPYGRLRIKLFMEELAKAGFDAILDEKSSPSTIKVEKERAYFEMSDYETHLICDFSEDDTLRQKLKDVLLVCLDKF